MWGEMRRRLNNRGKIAVAVLLVTTAVLLYGLVSDRENRTYTPLTKLEPLSFSSAPMTTFEDSTLNQSIIEKEMRKKELSRQRAVSKQNKADQRENAIFLTFDDGPSNSTNQLVDILDEYQMKATFFMTGKNITEYPNPVKLARDSGFGLGLHSVTHNVNKVYNSPLTPVEEMTENQKILEDVAGVHSNMIRLPYGSIPYLTEEMRYLLDKNNFHIWDWNVDSRDWDLKDERYVQLTIQEIQQMEQARETPIILLHDKPETIKHLPKLLSYIKKRDYKSKVLTNDMAPVTFPCEGRCHSIN